MVDEAEEHVHFCIDYNRHDVIYWGAKLPLACAEAVDTLSGTPL